MRIGIVTVQDLNNFGTFLQAYGMQSVLERMGHEVFFIRTCTKKYTRGMFYRIRPYGKEYLHLPSFLCTNLRGWKKHQVFKKDQKCFRVLECYDEDALDLVILGSDEIWNTTNPLFRSPVFYGDGMRNVMAYAPSIGNATYEDMRCIPGNRFHRIDPVFARDERTAEFLKTLGITAPRVCDPTILAETEVFQRSYSHPQMRKSPYLLVYAYGHEISELIREEIIGFARERGLRVLSVGFYLDWCDGSINCGPLDFCAVLKGAEYVFTATFHGTVFSILMHKQFVCLPYSPKTVDVLNSLGLPDRAAAHRNINRKVLAAILDTAIDYQAVDLRLEQQRISSLGYLRNSIEKYRTGDQSVYSKEGDDGCALPKF